LRAGLRANAQPTRTGAVPVRLAWAVHEWASIVNQPSSPVRWTVKLSSQKTILMAGGIGAAAAAALIVSCATVERMVVAPPVIPGAKYVGMDTCAACHEKEVKNFKLATHARVHIQGAGEKVAGQGCESCHGAGSLHADAGGGKGKFIVNPGKNPEGCFQCHLDKQAEFNLPHHHPLKEGKMTCTTCHDPHGSDVKTPRGVVIARVNEACAQCHREQAKPHVFEHEALREGCTACHNVHGSINDKLLIERDNNLCMKCHGELAKSGTIGVGGGSHNSRMNRTCYSAGCHTAMHGSDINPHLRY
jgi:predicted CXXCH cytochrome family protein